MRPILEYHPRMRRWTVVSAMILAGALTAAQAQINGVPASVTSYGFGGHTQPNAPRASVTSLGPNGYQGSRFTTATPGPSRHHYTHGTYYPGYGFYYPYYSVVDPYAYGGAPDGGQASEPEPPDQYQGGPTIFDRRGNGAPYPNEYARQPQPAPEPASVQTASSVPEPAQPSTILVFKDGRRQEITNYAIVGSSLFDLTNGRRKIAISDLDLAATQKANDDQGIDFKLPVLPTGS